MRTSSFVSSFGHTVLFSSSSNVLKHHLGYLQEYNCLPVAADITYTCFACSLHLGQTCSRCWDCHSFSGAAGQYTYLLSCWNFHHINITLFPSNFSFLTRAWKVQRFLHTAPYNLIHWLMSFNNKPKHLKHFSKIQETVLFCICKFIILNWRKH